MSKTLFEETLQFRQPQLWVPYLILSAAVLGAQAYFPARSPGDTTFAGLLVPAISMFVLGGIGVLLYLSRLDVKVTPSGLHTRLYPLEMAFRDIEWKDIIQMRVTTVRPMKDFGGWGLRFGKNSKAYIVTGDICIELKLADGSLLYINTLEPEKLLSALTHGKEAASP